MKFLTQWYKSPFKEKIFHIHDYFSSNELLFHLSYGNAIIGWHYTYQYYVAVALQINVYLS